VATSEYVKNRGCQAVQLQPYVSGSLAAFKTAFAADWAAVLPAGSRWWATVACADYCAVHRLFRQVLTVEPNDWVGFNYGSWLVVRTAPTSGSNFIATSS